MAALAPAASPDSLSALKFQTPHAHVGEDRHETIIQLPIALYELLGLSQLCIMVP